MPVRVLVVDAYDRPYAGVTVCVKFKDGLSTVQTDSSGIADTRTYGTVEYISVNGKVFTFGAYYKDSLLKVKSP